MCHRAMPYLGESLGAVSDERFSLKDPGTMPFLNAGTIIVSSLMFNLTTCAPKR